MATIPFHDRTSGYRDTCARAYLTVIARNPKAVAEALAA
jgi:hypothetical protein